jgi:phosphomannomutase
MAQGGQGGLMVSVSGIRGRVGESLTPDVVATYAAAFGAWHAPEARAMKWCSGGIAASPDRCSTAS